MLPAKDELVNYLDCAGHVLPLATVKTLKGQIARMTPETAEAWMALIHTAEMFGARDAKDDAETAA